MGAKLRKMIVVGASKADVDRLHEHLTSLDWPLDKAVDPLAPPGHIYVMPVEDFVRGPRGGIVGKAKKEVPRG